MIQLRKQNNFLKKKTIKGKKDIIVLEITIQFFVPIFGVKKSVVAWLEIILNKPNNVNPNENSTFVIFSISSKIGTWTI